MTIPVILNTFSAGELSPSLLGRTDIAKYRQGASTMRNCFVNYRGGASSRAGLAYVGTCLQAGDASPPRDITFQYSINQGFDLEFGDQYMRIVSNGGYVVEATKAITGATNANPGVITSTAHGYSNGDWVEIVGVAGMTNFNGLTWIITNKTTNTFELTDLFGNIVNTTSFPSYISGGTTARIYTVVSPYAATDLPFLKYTQEGNTLSLCCVNQQTGTEYLTYELLRVSDTDWTFTAPTFASAIAAPTGVSVSVTSSTTVDTWYSYVVTAVNAGTGEESIASSAGTAENNNISIYAGTNTVTWNPVTGASSYNVYKATPSYNVGVPIGVLYGFAGSSLSTSFTDSNVTQDFTQVPPVHLNPFARGQITDVVPTAGGIGFTQAGIGYSITTSTGSGFVGTPIVLNGIFSDFLIQDNGIGYAVGDTITITGGNAGGFATGTYTFTVNPTNSKTIVLNGITWTFVTTPSGAHQTALGATVSATLGALVGDLNASTSASLNVASYSLNGLILTVTYLTAGSGGNAYTLAVGTYGGAISGATLAGGGTTSAAATLTIGAESGTYPGAVSYYQQRRVYSYTLNMPNTYFMSQPGAYLNMDASIPTVDSDAIVGAPWAQQINGIQFTIPMQTGLVTLAGTGAWLVSGGNSAVITPADQTATSQAFNGCHYHINPIVINYDILYVQAKGSIVRDSSYNFFTNNYTGTDKTIFSNHLFNYHQIQQWAYAEEPYKIIWSVRDDGRMLSFTFLKDQEIDGWARHDTNGLFVGSCSVTEPPVDAIYVNVKRYIQGQKKWMYYKERMDNRNWVNAEDCFCVDAGLSYPVTYPNAVLTPASADGTDNISGINLIFGGINYTSPILSAEDPTGLGNGFSAVLIVVGGVITSYMIINEGEGYSGGTKLVVSDSTGSGAVLQSIITNNVIFTASAGVFDSSMIGDVIRIGNNNASEIEGFSLVAIGGGKAIITSFISATEVIADITEPITSVVPNDPFSTPIPASATQWSIATPTTIVSGLNHLEGMTVTGLADGSVIVPQTVVNGVITLPEPASAITVGLSFTAQLQSMPLDVPGQTTSQGKRKSVPAVTVRMEASRGMSCGVNQIDASTQPNNVAPPWTNMTEFKERNANITAGSAIPLFTGDHRIIVSGSWDEKCQIALQQTYPLPMNVLAAICEVQIGDSNG